MNEGARERLVLDPIAEDAEVGRWLSALEDGRRDTLRELDGVTDAMVDVRVTDELNTIGTLLYHVALIEADWLLDDIFDDRGAWPVDLLPFGDRDPKGTLTEVRGLSGQKQPPILACQRASGFSLVGDVVAIP